MSKKQRTANNLEIITESAEETKAAGKILIEEILKEKPIKKSAFVIGLEGELGSGKTTFVQGMAECFGIREKITSPTFTILKKYEIQNTRYKIRDTNFYHIDCYRLFKPKDLIDLDFKEIISSPKNIIVIEWAERVRKILPKDALWIKFKYLGQGKRKITI